MAEKKMSISTALCSDFTKQLGTTLNLTDEQIMKAKGTALQLAAMPNLKECDTYSLIRYCYTIARYNFSRDDAVYPVPYDIKGVGTVVQAQMGYQGLRELAMRTGKYHKIDCVEVKECDSVTTNDEGEPVVTFDKDYVKRMNAKTIGYYAYAIYKNNKFVKRLFWTKEMCEKHGHLYSRYYGGMWTKHFDKMAKKTLLKQLCKDLDSSPELQNAIKDDQLVFGTKNTENSYADNPSTHPTFFDASNQEAKTSVKNTILPPTGFDDFIAEEKEKEEVPAKEKTEVTNGNK